MPVEVDKSDRSELKSHFVRNAIPTEGHFADLIDAMINQREDGIAKLPGNPLSVEAAGDQSKAVDFYGSFADASPSWSISLNARPDPRKPATVPGLAVNDSSGQPRLFIDAKTGALGVGTLSTEAAGLTVAGSVRMNSTANPILVNSAHTGVYNRTKNGAEISNDTGTYKTLMIIGNSSGGLGRRVSVWDRLEVNGTLKVTKQEAWKAPNFAHRWVNYGGGYYPAGFMKDSLGFVHLRGLVKSGAVGGNAWVFTLPTGYRPAFRTIFAQQTHPDVAGRLDIAADGKVVPYGGIHPGWLSLEGITFQAA